MGKSTISMAIFNSYVSLPEGIKNICSMMFHGYARMFHHSVSILKTTKPHRFLLWSRESCRQRTIALGRFLWSVQSDATQLWRHIKDTVDGPAKSESPVDKWFIPLFTLWLCQNNYGKSQFLAMCPMKNGGSFHSYFLGGFQPSNPRWFIPWFSWLFNMFHPSKMGGGLLDFAGPPYVEILDKKSGDVEILEIMQKNCQKYQL